MITELESIVKMPREDFNIYPEERSAIFGDLTIEYTVPGYEGKTLVLTTHPDGVMILRKAISDLAFKNLWWLRKELIKKYEINVEKS
jgi:hypothetical protein